MQGRSTIATLACGLCALLCIPTELASQTVLAGKSTAASGMLFYDTHEATERNGKIFRYSLVPDKANCITLDFNLVESPAKVDFIKVYAGERAQGEPIASLGGASGSRFLQVEATSITFEFDRNAAGAASVWTALWGSPAPEVCILPKQKKGKPYQDICGPIFKDSFQHYGNAAGRQESQTMGCLPTAHNTALYRFQAVKDGQLAFSIFPANQFDDFDWILWRENKKMDSAGSKLDTLGLRLACNYSGGRGKLGMTGMDAGAQEWQLAKPTCPLSQSVEVRKGEVFFLFVDDFSGHSSGLEIHLSDVVMTCDNGLAPSLDLGSTKPDFPAPKQAPTFMACNKALRIDLSAKANRGLAEGVVSSDVLAAFEQQGKGLPSLAGHENLSGISCALLAGLRSGWLKAYHCDAKPYPLHFGDLLELLPTGAERSWDNLGSVAFAPFQQFIELLVEEGFDKTSGMHRRQIRYLRLLWADGEGTTPDFNVALFRWEEAKALLDAITVPHPRNDAGTMSMADYLEQGLYDAVVIAQSGRTIRSLSQSASVQEKQAALQNYIWAK